MGDIKRKKSKFRKPKQKYEKVRIDEEKEIIKKYGLKNKKEIWKAEAEISKIRKRAKSLISKSEEKQREFFEKLNWLGLKVNSIADVLALTKGDWFDRRLQTFVFKKRLANSIKQARQIIVHKQILVNGKIVNVPSLVVGVNLEDKISLKQKEKSKNKTGETKNG